MAHFEEAIKMVNIDDINRLIVDAIIELSGDGSIKGLWILSEAVVRRGIRTR